MKKKITKAQKDFLERTISQNRPKNYTKEMEKEADRRIKEIESMLEREKR
ncbi:MAG: hypothetical protein Q4E50_07280 [Tissierellia bacterium]|nr:hypothetical protein [Tissierellia bacterium]